MSGAGLARTAIANSFASMSRTVLTVVAIFIGAFTLTLTTAVGTGISAYIDNTTSAIGSATTLSVTKTPADGDGPVKYDADTTVTTNNDPGPDGGTVQTLTEDDLSSLRDVDGVVTAEPVVSLTPDYVVYEDGRPYRLQAAGDVAGTELQLVTGTQPDPDSTTRQIAIPQSFVDPLEFSDAADAVDKTVTIGVTDAKGKQTKITAKVVAVIQPTLAGGEVAQTNDALTKVLYDRQSVGLSTKAKERYTSATIEVDSTAAAAADIATLKSTLSDDGYTAKTVDDQIGDFKGVIDTIVLVLNGFAIIALLAAGFGIVNTLLMSVKERTRGDRADEGDGPRRRRHLHDVQPRGCLHRLPRQSGRCRSCHSSRECRERRSRWRHPRQFARPDTDGVRTGHPARHRRPGDGNRLRRRQHPGLAGRSVGPDRCPALRVTTSLKGETHVCNF